MREVVATAVCREDVEDMREEAVVEMAERAERAVGDALGGVTVGSQDSGAESQVAKREASLEVASEVMGALMEAKSAVAATATAGGEGEVKAKVESMAVAMKAAVKEVAVRDLE